jgi:hypothetical protein
VYHLELRHFPHSLFRFNLSEQELRAIVEPWTREPLVELGEQKWRTGEAKLTILEGPELPLEQLSMGRGWGAAQRKSQDVTERVLAAARAAGTPPGAPAQESPQPSSADAALVADSLGLELLALLGDGPAPLSRAWRLAGARFPERPPSECLALAERAVGSLLRGGLIVMLRPATGDGHGPGDQGPGGAQVGETEVEPLLRALDSWAEPSQSTGVLVRRV